MYIPQTNFYMTGAPSATAGHNLLNPTTASANALDLAALSLTAYRSLTVTFVGAPPSGAVAFEGSNDNTNFLPIHGIETAYEWSNLVYSTFSYPFGGLNSSARTFEIPLRFRYVRARISTALGGTALTAYMSFSPTEFVRPPIGQFPAANFLLTATSNASTIASISAVSAGPNGVRNYYCGAELADGSSGGSVIDWWICDGSGPGGNKLGSCSRATSGAESMVHMPPAPRPCGFSNGIQLYLNNAPSVNVYYTVWYFRAP